MVSLRAGDLTLDTDSDRAVQLLQVLKAVAKGI
jgi:hypothetical protein